MGILSDQPRAVEQVITETAQAPQEAPREFPSTTSIKAPNLVPSAVEPAFDPIQSVQTNNRVATGRVVNRSDNPLPLHIAPTIEDEVYAVDIVDDTGRVIYSVNAHSGRFSGRIPLPKGEFTYFIKTQRNDMPFAVKWD